MSLQRVPWAVNGPDVAHSATLARQANFAALGGQTGIVGPDSLEVVAGETPGPFVNVMPGPGTITYAQGRGNAQNRAYAQAKDQLVPIRNDALEQVDIAPTTSAGPRTDLVVVEVNDPEFEGTSDSVDYSAHEFVRFHVIRGVNQNVRYPWQLQNLPRPTLPLAQVRIPASTATITEDMIYDVRHMASARSHTENLTALLSPDTTGSGYDIPHTQTTWETVLTFSDVSVPQWATRAKIQMMITSLYAVGGRANGQFRVLLRGQNSALAGPNHMFVEDSGVWTRFQVHTAGNIPLHWRTAGSTLDLELQIRRTHSWTGAVRIPAQSGNASHAIGSVTFEEQATVGVDMGV